jgi:hypothetical protein
MPDVKTKRFFSGPGGCTGRYASATPARVQRLARAKSNPTEFLNNVPILKLNKLKDGLYIKQLNLGEAGSSLNVYMNHCANRAKLGNNTHC